MRYILDDNGYIDSVSCTPFNCKDKSCKEYTGAIPTDYESLTEWATTSNIRAYKLVDGNLVYDEARATELEAEWAVYKDPKIVYDMTLTTATNSIDVTGLDMVRDGGEYEFEFYHKEDTTGDLNITFNDIYSDYYTAGSYISGSLKADGTPTCVYFYRQAKTRIYYGTGGGSDGNINFPATMKGRFYFSNNTRKTIGFELKNHLVVNGTQAIVDQCGVNGKAVDNLTSINFTKENNGNFVAGTRLIVRKK